MRVMGYDTPAARDDSFELSEKSSVKTALSEYLKRYDIGLSVEELSKAQFLVDGKAYPLDGELYNNCKLTVVRLLGGG